MDKYIKITNEFIGMKLSVKGIINKSITKTCKLSKSERFSLEEISRLYYEGREAWLKGDIKTVAEMFGILR